MQIKNKCMMSDDQFLKVAIEQSAIAAGNGEFPYGAVLGWRGEVVLRAMNTTLSTKDFTTHAEINIIRMASQNLPEPFALEECVLYCSCEPCAMCSGAIYWAGIRKVVYGCSTDLDARISTLPFAIPCRSIFAVAGGHHVDVRGPLLESDAASVLRKFWPEYLRSNTKPMGLSV